jgi:DNA-binding transcriptional MerR regulator/methylmalonyl-CoA mutase cobalamin-binding subunit
MYSIKAVAQATGLTVETLRAWERRYGIVAPNRDASGRRVYRPEDVLRLRRLREATERGHPIGRLAGLSDDELAALLNESTDRRTRATTNAFVERILESAQRFRSAECEQALTLAIAMLPPPQLVGDVLQPLLREVGERWHRGEFAISQERLVSTIVRRHVGLMLDAYDRNARRAPIVFATLPGERHELGLLTSAMMCASRGFKTHYLGPDLPPAEIARFAREVNAAAVALSVVLQDRAADAPAQLAELVSHLPAETAVWLGGSAARELQRELLPSRCVVLADGAELEQRLEMLPA